MKILIIGTSNGIMKPGYIGSLQKVLPHATIVNLSIGASPSFQFAAHCQDDLTEYDAIILEGIVNDECNLFRLAGSHEYASELLFEIYSTFSHASKLIVMGLCNKQYVYGEVSDVWKLHRSIATEVGAHFLDCPAFIRDNEHLMKDGPAYRDEHHPSGEMAHCLGLALAWYVTNKPRNYDVRSFKDNFMTIFADKLPGCPRSYHKSNSLTSDNFALLEENETLTLNADGFGIVGLYLDITNTRGFLHVPAPRKRDIRLFYQPHNEGFELKFVTVSGGVQALSLQCCASAKEFEHGVHEKEKVDGPWLPHLSISRIACWRGVSRYTA